MRSTLTLLALLCLLPFSGQAAVDLILETRTFHHPKRGPRVEVNMAVLAGSALVVPNERGFMQARVEITTIIEQEGQVKAFSKTEVLGPERLDSSITDLLHQEYYDLAPGAYDLIIEARDLVLGDTTVARYRQPLAVGALPAGVNISNILLAERIDPSTDVALGKYGYQVVPLLSDYYPSSITTLNFYAEVYGAVERFGADSLYLLTYQIESFEKKSVFGAFKRLTRTKAKEVEPIIASFDIKDLPSGNYVLAIEVRDKKGELLSRGEQFFMRNNPVSYDYDLQAMDRLDLSNVFAGAFADADSLVEHINSMRPIADPLERKIIDDRLKDEDLELMKRFFYSFWANRSVDPEQAWREYREQVVKVNKAFGCRVLKGYETDRGIVYLKYGAPNTMMDRFNEMGTVPYTIWHYYRAGKYTNRRFVFYQPDLANTCMQLLHSEVPGEIQNPQWNNILHQRNVAMPGVQTQDPNTLESDRVREFYNDPR
jgi:GWxTD domain-containing protein